MSCLFICSHKFIVNNDGQVFSDGQFSKFTWERYTIHFGSLVVSGRMREIDLSKILLSNFVNSTHEKVTFKLFKKDSCFIKHAYEKYIYIKELLSYAKKSEIVIIRSSIFGIFFANICRVKGYNYVIEVVACPWDSLFFSKKILKIVSAPLVTLLTRLTIYRAKNVVYVTDKFLQYRYPHNKSANVLSCSNVEIYNYSQEILGARIKKLNSKLQILQFGIIASLDAGYKGIDVIFKAVSLIKNSRPFVVRILGNGDKSRWINLAKKYRIEKLIYFDGTLASGASVNFWLDNLDVYLQPSFQEGLPRSLIEAMSRGLPVIGSTCGGIPELLMRDDMIKPGDYNGLSTLMLRAITNSDWRIKAASRNFQKAEDYTKKKLDVKRFDYYNKIKKIVN